MNDLKRYCIKFKTVSNVVLSPRENHAFYKGIDFEEEDIESCDFKDKKPNIIYPFYQYGEYEEYNPKENKYYIPGSSVKGAIYNQYMVNSEESKLNTLMVDDAKILSSNIELKQLYKVQYLNKEDITGELTCQDKRKFIKSFSEINFLDIKNPPNSEQKDLNLKKQKLDKFFENVAIEMLKPKVSFDVTMYYREYEQMKNLIDNVTNKTKKKIKRNLEYIRQLKDTNKDIKMLLDEEINALTIVSNKNLMFVGGYKGLMNSIVDITINDGALFMDEDLKLPYGLVEVVDVEECLN